MINGALAGLAVLAAFVTPVLAVETRCDDAAMASMNTEIGGMKDAGKRKSAMDEMRRADAALKKHDVKRCTAHLNKAMASMKAL